jgi:hypothetical protein
MIKFANIASIVCVLHCTILPLFMIFLPTSALYLMLDSKVEFILLFISCAINIYNVCFGIKTHKNYNILWFFSLGIIITFAGYFLNEHKHSDHKEINYLMIIGSIMLIFSNIINNKICKLCRVCNTGNIKCQKK